MLIYTEERVSLTLTVVTEKYFYSYYINPYPTNVENRVSS